MRIYYTQTYRHITVLITLNNLKFIWLNDDLYFKQGFETRGTEIGNRQVTWDNLIKALEKGTELIDDITRIPTNILPQQYKDIDLRKNDIIVKFVRYVYYY